MKKMNMKMGTKMALKAHMSKGKGAHPDANAKKMAKGGAVRGCGAAQRGKSFHEA